MQAKSNLTLTDETLLEILKDMYKDKEVTTEMLNIVKDRVPLFNPGMMRAAYFFYEKKMPLNNIATMLLISEASVKSHLRNLRRRFRDSITYERLNSLREKHNIN